MKAKRGTSREETNPKGNAEYQNPSSSSRKVSGARRAQWRGVLDNCQKSAIANREGKNYTRKAAVLMKAPR